ncbi:MAG TPA: hypothetical protein PK095_07205, partial [Myxococcota bacterium]|nr:hypothetical protein [Myxococcota bacterium]
MIVLLLAALLSQPGPSADQAILATAGRIAARIPAHDDRLWTLASIAHKARDVGDVARAKHLVQLALTDLESLPETVAYDRVAPDLADVFELVAIADGCEHVDTWLADQIHRPFFSPAPNYLRVCAQGGFGARVEHLFRSVELTRDNAWLAAQAFVEGGALPTNAVVERFDAFFRLPDNDLSRRSRIDGEITVADQIGAGRACVGAMWRLQGDAAKALAWAKPFVAKPALVGNNGLFCLARAMPEPAVWMALARSIEHGTPYERAERFRRLAWGMRRQGAPDAELAR